MYASIRLAYSDCNSIEKQAFFATSWKSLSDVNCTNTNPGMPQADHCQLLSSMSTCFDMPRAGAIPKSD
jgi:hypothetical protein